MARVDDHYLRVRDYAERFNLTRGMFPVAEMVSDRVLSLPLSTGMTDGECARVIDALRWLLVGKR